MSPQDQRIKEILEREFSITVIDVWTERDSGETTCAKFSLRQGRIFSVCADWDVDSTVETVADEIARRSRQHPARSET